MAQKPPEKRKGRGQPIPKDGQRCTATAKGSGERCTQFAMRGLNVCRAHGGASPTARAAGLRRYEAEQHTRRLQARANAILAHEGLKPVEDPLQELGKLANSALALVEALGARVNALDALELLDDKGAVQARVEAEMYERAMDRAHRFLDSLVKHGYTERQIAIAESEALLVAGVIRRVLAGLGLTKEQQTRAQELLSEEFRNLKPRVMGAN